MPDSTYSGSDIQIMKAFRAPETLNDARSTRSEEQDTDSVL